MKNSNLPLKKAFIITGISRGLGSALFNAFYSDATIQLLMGIGRSFTHVQQNTALQNPDRIKLIEADFSTQFDLNKIPIAFDGENWEVNFILNAGVIQPIGLSGNVEDKDFVSALTVNFISHVRICHYFLKYCHPKNQFSIINISSGVARHPVAGLSAYCSAKAAMRMYLECLSQEYRNIYIKHIDPGILDTDMQNEARSASPDDFPDVLKFRAYKKENQLRNPDQVAIEIINQVKQR